MRRTGRHYVTRPPSAAEAWAQLLVGIALAAACIVLIVWVVPRTGATLAPTSGTVIGFRFSGDFPHRCRLWIKPAGNTIAHRVLLDPNSEAECLNARIGDRWERVR